MRTSFLSLAASLALVGFTSALPAPESSNIDMGLYNFLSKRVVSPDETCGNNFNGDNKSYVCDISVNQGGCCSM
jgi:hypothetical protein